jgi:hypothetical protein
MTTPAPRAYPLNGRQLTVKINQAGQEAVVVLGGRLTAGPEITAAKASAWLDTFWAAFRPVILGTYSCTGATLRDVNAAEGTVVEVGQPPNPTGFGGSGDTVAAACTLVKWSTAKGGRSGKGRTYIPGLSSAAVSPGGRTYDSGHVTKVNTAIAAYLNSGTWGTINIVPAVLSFTKGESNTITGGSIAAVVGVQRRRMR